jgi:hypothetical protein
MTKDAWPTAGEMSKELEKWKPDEKERLLDELGEQQLLTCEFALALRRLVLKIDYERKRGTPLSPKGHPDCEWDAAHPVELTEARELLTSWSGQSRQLRVADIYALP